MSFTHKIVSTQLSLLDTLIPNLKQLTAEDLRRARLMVGILFYSIILSIILGYARYQSTGYSYPTLTIILQGLILSSLLFSYKITRKLNLISDMTIALLLASITAIIYNDGGLTSRATNWLTGFPLLAQFIGHRIKSKNIFISIVFILTSLFYLNSSGVIASLETSQGLLARTITLSMVVLFIAIISSLFDNSRRLLQEQITIEKDNAEQAFKLKSEFLATMSHELRTPFNGVLGMLELLNNSTLTDQQKHRVGLAKNSAESLLLLIDDILDFSKIEAGKQDIESIDFNIQSLFGNIAKASAYQANEKGIEIILDIYGIQKTHFKGDPNRLRQITTNLISNAIKFTQDGDVIITVRSEANKPTKNNQSTHTLYVSIKDSGIGIPKDKIDILFHSFTQIDASTSRKFGGSGLGLTIARNLCQLMGGDISVNSTEGLGSTFSFTLKLLESDNTQAVNKINIENKHIVIIDNNEHALYAIKKQLSNRNANIITFINSTTANQYITNDKTHKIDLILIDVNMPCKNGLELSKDIRKLAHLDNTKIVLMSDIDTLDDDQVLKDIGVNGIFPKPVTPKDLDSALKLITTEKYSTSLKEQKSTLGENQKKTNPTTQVCILIVDDNLINLEVAAALLENINVHPIVANSAMEAYKILTNHDKKDLIQGILMDCQMPNIDGFEATKTIRSGVIGNKHTSIPIIALTANAMKGDKEKCILSGMDDYLTKPIDIEKLEKSINKIIKKDTN